MVEAVPARLHHRPDDGTQRPAAWADELGGEIGEADLHTANAILAQIVDVMASREPTT